MKIELSSRVKKLPSYIFAEIEKIINEKKQKGVNLISLSIGDPDLPPPTFVLEALKREAGERDIWIRLNRIFLDRLRKQLLLWRTIKPEERDKYQKRKIEFKNKAK